MLDKEIIFAIEIFNKHSLDDYFWKCGQNPYFQEKMLEYLCDYGDDQLFEITKELNNENIVFMVDECNHHNKAKFDGRIMMRIPCAPGEEEDLSFLRPMYNKVMEKWQEYGIVKKLSDTEYVQYELLDDGLKKFRNDHPVCSAPN